MKRPHPTALIILDGFGYSPETNFNAIAQAVKPTFDFFLSNYPHTLLQASGNAVGLPDGFMGNSEVGHLTLGAGRIIPSSFLTIHQMVKSGEIKNSSILQKHFSALAQSNKKLHIMGLLSDAGVNSNLEIISPLLDAAMVHGIKNIVLHPFLDGRDTVPKMAANYLNDLDKTVKKFPVAKIGSITGRYYAMDRDKHWDRTEKAYDMLIGKQNIQFSAWKPALDYYYLQNITDEFVPPTLLDKSACICHGDGIVFFNFREDRARQLTACFVTPEMVPFHPCVKSSFFITPIQFDSAFHNPVLFERAPIHHTLKEVLCDAGKSIFSIAETEKYAHVTYFFSGGKETPFEHEKQKLIPSLAVKNYIDHPCMSAPEITKAIIHSLQKNPADFYLINYANADMVGHSGNLPATIKAIECLDAQLKELYTMIVERMNGTIYITADHGNAEKKYDATTKQPWTAHTTNPVPFMMINRELEDSDMQLPLHELADVAPFILQQMGLPVPEEMKH